MYDHRTGTIDAPDAPEITRVIVRACGHTVLNPFATGTAQATWFREHAETHNCRKCRIKFRVEKARLL